MWKPFEICTTITKKKNTMADAGDDPLESPAFKDQDELFAIRVEDYRFKLKTNGVETDENDLIGGAARPIDRLKRYAPQFAKFYKMLNDYIGKEIGA